MNAILYPRNDFSHKRTAWSLLLVMLLMFIPSCVSAKNDVEKEVKTMLKTLQSEGWDTKAAGKTLQDACKTYIMHRDEIDEETGFPRYVLSQKTLQGSTLDLARKKAQMQAKAEIMQKLQAAVKSNEATELDENGERYVRDGSIVSEMDITPNTILELSRKLNDKIEIRIIAEYDIRLLKTK